MSQTPSVFVARFYHESNRLNPVPTTEDRFQIERGTEVFTNASGVLAGMIATLKQNGVEVLPGISIGAPPSGLVDHAFFERVKTELCAMVKSLSPDAIAVELHGAASTTELADAEGDLVAALRAAAGPDVPVGIGLDLHAHLTDAMIANTDICCACKENPHSDTVECGNRVAELLLECLDGRLKPVVTLARVPMILPGAADTAAGPLFEIHEAARQAAAANPAIRDISIYNVFRFMDDDEIGQVVTVTSDGTDPQAGKVAVDLANAFWENRERFKDKLASVDEAFSTIRSTGDNRPYVLGDMGDRVLAGAPGDSVFLLSALLDGYPDLRAAISITDPQGAEVAIAAGVGATIDPAVGGGITPGFAPRRVRAEVIHVSDGNFVLAGPFHGGEPSSLGPTAVIRVDGRIDLVLTTLPAYGHDPAVYTSQGVDIAAKDFVVAKSGYHFMLNYAGVATPMLVETPGVGYYGKGLFPYEKSRFWPEHAVSPDIKPIVFGERA